MSRIIIHIGTHKTATSYIQNLFRENRALLRKHKIIYPVVRGKLGQHALVGVWNKLLIPDDQFNAIEAWQKISKRYAKSNYTVFVSSEELSRFNGSYRVNIQQLHELTADFDEVKLIYTLRNQASFLQSLYYQVATNRASVPLEKSIEEALERHLSQQLDLNYNKVYSQLITVFKRAEIRLISYDQAASKPGGIAQAFLDEINTDITYKHLMHSSIRHDNISAWPLAIFLASKISGNAVPTRNQIKSMQDLLQETYGENAKTTIFTTDEVAQFTEVFSPLNDELRKRVAFYLPDFEIGPMLNAQTPLYRDALTADFWQHARQRFSQA
jgi:hypothetical protein